MAIMTERPYSIAQARNQLTRLVREAEKGGTIGLTRRGKLVAVVLSEPEYRRLSGSSDGLREAMRAFLQQRPARGVLTARQVKSLRDRSPGRAVAW